VEAKVVAVNVDVIAEVKGSNQEFRCLKLIRQLSAKELI
jgi:hypothetical protein